jgi:hypothetical protein
VDVFALTIKLISPGIVGVQDIVNSLKNKPIVPYNGLGLVRKYFVNNTGFRHAPNICNLMVGTQNFVMVDTDRTVSHVNLTTGILPAA